MNHRLLIGLSFIICQLSFSSLGAQTPVKVSVTNPTDEYRQEVIELDAAAVTAQVGTTFRVLEGAGLDVPYQLSHDGKLLLEACVRPQGTARFTIVSGQSPRFPTVCHGALHPERKDDFAWENDRGAYRVYGPALGRTGERSFGIDVWTKNTPELVVDDRYYLEDVVMMPIVDSLRRADRHRGDSLYRTISYHHDHGRGLDPYKVGATLGCGAPALMADGKIVFPYCYRSYEILDDGPLRFSVRLDYAPKAVQGDSVTEHRIITLDKGSNFNRMTVWYEGLSHALAFTSGVVVQKEDTQPVVLGTNYVSYRDPTDQPNVHHAPLYVAVLFPYDKVRTCQQEGHALAVLDDYRGQPLNYYFGSAWTKYDVRNAREWQARIDWFLASLASPLQIDLQ